MQQQKPGRQTTATVRLRRAFWGRDSITSATLVYGSTAVTLGYLISLVTPWLTGLLGGTFSAALLVWTIGLAILACVTGWVTAKVAPRYSVVPWATLIPLFLVVYIWPQLVHLWQDAGGFHTLLWQLVLGFVSAAVLQSIVLLSTRRRNLSPRRPI